MKTSDIIDSEAMPSMQELSNTFTRVAVGPLVQRVRDMPAGELEYQGWLETLRYEREDRCPDGRIHAEVPTGRRGFYGQCLRCGHNTLLPF